MTATMKSSRGGIPDALLDACESGKEAVLCGVCGGVGSALAAGPAER